MGRLHLRLLGGFVAETAEGGAVKVSNRRNQALLGILALDPGQRHARDKLVELLWGERGGDQGRNSLRQGLAVLRKELADAVPGATLVAGEGELLFVPPDTIEVDALVFERLARSGDAADLRAAADLYRDNLFDGFGLREPGFEAWVASSGKRFRELALGVFDRLIPQLDGSEAVAMARRLVDLDPLREDSQRRLIGLIAEQGETELALKQYRSYCAALDRELALKPSETIQALYRDIAGGRRRKPAEPDDAAAKPDLRLAERPLIAVLPFANRSIDAAHQAFCESLADDIADAISRVASFLVVSGPAITEYRSRSADLRAVGDDLAVAYLVQGSVQRQGERMRISVQLSDAVSGHHIWVEQYDGVAAEIFGIQETIVRAIAASTETHVMLAVRNLVTRDAARQTFDALITRGISLLYDETPAALDEILDLAERAMIMAPKDVRAHQLLAEAVVQRLSSRVVEFGPAMVARGVALARTAVGMAPNNEWMHLLLARALIEAGEIEAAIAESELALEINPSSHIAFVRMGECYALLGRAEQSIEATQMALKLESRGPETYRRHFTLGLAHFTAGNDAEALREASRAAMWRPDYTRADLLVAATAAALRQKPEAEAAVARCLERYPDLRADAVAPRVMPPFARAEDQARLTALLRAAGLP